MVRKLALAVSLALGTLSVPVHALGLGELSSKSALNQNFNGDITLLSVNPDEIGSVRVKLADEQAFSRAGVERPFYLSLLKFEPLLTKRSKPVIRVTSEFPIREPFLNFLIEVNWPNGRLLREYTVLLDPPTTTMRRPPVVKPAAKTVQPTAQRAVSPAPTRPAAVAAPAESAATASEYGPVQANETAWAIARKVRPGGVSMEQMMMALLEANPHAFINNDINRLRRGRILRVPALAEIQQLSRAEARAAYRQQQDQWLARRDEKLQQAAQAEQGDATSEGVAGAGAAEGDEGSDQLRIATARPEGQGEAGAGDDDAVSPTASDLKSRLIAARENAETSRQEAETLRSHVDDLQARLQDMQKLLTLKDEQLARLQDNVAGQEEVPEAVQSTADSPAAAPETPSDDITMANQVDPGAVAEQAAEAVGAVESAAADAEVIVEGVEPSDDAESAIDEAVADLVAATSPEDIPSQMEQDQVIESTGAVGEPVADAVSELEIPVQIDPDRIVMGLDAGAPSAESGETELVIDAAAGVAGGEASGEVVIEDMPGGVEITMSEQPDTTAPAIEPEIEASTGSIQPVDTQVMPTPVESQAEAPSASAPLIPPSLASTVEQNIVPIAAGGVAVLGFLGWLFTLGRRKQEDGEELLATAGDTTIVAAAAATAEREETAVDEPILDPDSLADLPDSSFLDEFSPGDIDALQDETGEVDPVSEADVYIAYGRYQQAEELLGQAMERDPDRLALKHKLLEVHYATRDAAAFATLAQQMVDAGQDSADEEAWARAQDMGRELAPDNALFAASGEEGSSDEDVAADIATGAAAVTAVDSDTLSLDDLELSQLTTAYEEESSSLSDLEPTSEVSITLDLDDVSELKGPAVASAPEPAGLGDMEPLEFEMPDADSVGVSADDGAVSETLDLDAMMDEAEAVVDRESTELGLDSDFSAAELQAQLDELSDLSALGPNVDDADQPVVAELAGGVGLVSEDVGAGAGALDEPLSLDTALEFDSQDDTRIDTLELEDSMPSDEDEVGTKLDLARAYVEMGDDDGARGILEEVITEGDDGQRGEAKKLLSGLG